MHVLLEAAGYVVVSVGSCSDARASLKSLVFPFVIIDRGLGDGDGLELITEIRELGGRSRVYIMMLTGMDSAAEIERGIRAGADSYLSKRSSDEDIVSQLKAAKSLVQLRMS